MKIRNHTDLRVFTLAMDASMEIFELSKQFPMEERYSLTDQIRRSSRSVCANLAEAWRKRRYEKAFIAKLSDVEGEAAETQVWLQYASNCGYLASEKTTPLYDKYTQVLAMTVAMINNSHKWTL